MNALKISPNDNVVTVIEPIPKNGSIHYAENDCVVSVTAIEDIPVYHKAAITDISAGSRILKYGEVIGITSASIKIGALVHVHNVVSAPSTIFFQ